MDNPLATLDDGSGHAPLNGDERVKRMKSEHLVQS